MGETKQQWSLVVMNNGDVYYVTEAAAKELMSRLHANQTSFFETVDQKSRKQIAVALRSVSSVVIGGRDAR